SGADFAEITPSSPAELTVTNIRVEFEGNDGEPTARVAWDWAASAAVPAHAGVPSFRGFVKDAFELDGALLPITGEARDVNIPIRSAKMVSIAGEIAVVDTWCPWPDRGCTHVSATFVQDGYVNPDPSGLMAATRSSV